MKRKIAVKPLLVFQTDFIYKEGVVSSMYRVVKCADRELEIMDGTHELPQFDTWSASYRLYQNLQFWPEGTVYMSVVDPGVGVKRRPCVAKTVDGYYTVTPDNGSPTHVKKLIGIGAVREIDESVNRLRGKGTEGVAIFHRRDLFGYTAARLASGIIDLEGVGPEYPAEEIVEHEILEPHAKPGKVDGVFKINDPNFGDLWTNIPLKTFQETRFVYGDYVTVKVTHEGEVVFDQRVLFHQSFGFAQKGDSMIYSNELMKVAMAVSRDSLNDKYSLPYGPDQKVEFTK